MNITADVVAFIKQNLSVLLHDVAEEKQSGVIGPNLATLKRLVGLGSVDQVLANTLYELAVESSMRAYTLLSEVDGTVRHRFLRV